MGGAPLIKVESIEELSDSHRPGSGMAAAWFLLLVISTVSATLCPDGSACGEKSLCCERPGEEKGYSCCPEAEVVSHSLPMMLSQTSCFGPSSCPDEYSCVETPQGGSACCPLTEGKSCQDGHHCCSSGSYCSDDGHYCIPASNQSAVVCPDGRSECPALTSCCLMSDMSSWGCCPMPEAVCCEDHVHCCPHDSQCDVTQGRCVSRQDHVPWMNKLPARVRLVGFGDEERLVPCPDGTSCPDGSTCCEKVDHTYGCCSILSAVCCSDHLHCCPGGTTCDLVHKKCVSRNGEGPLLRQMPAIQQDSNLVPCDVATTCPNNNTCCRLASGKWGCCPIEKAVCCNDHKHCCPEGYTCSLGKCSREEHSIPWLLKTPALTHKAGDVKCDDMYSCPDGQTCCLLASGDWACCPIAQAVCCDDHEHCCPPGYTCSEGDCQKGALSIPWLSKTPALKQEAGDVKCDDMYSCPDGQTCCLLASGDWGCCPIAQAVCCDDHEHCCPPGYTCSGSQCMSGGLSIPWLSKTPSLKQEGTTVKCDDSFSCNDGQTCCRMQSGVWGCCPIAQAVCCSDHWHCCPQGFTCDTRGTCVLGRLNLPGLMKVLALSSDGNWCDESHSCPSGTTCCPGEGGGWSCCPLQEAVCCSDHQHCCPTGYTCNLAAGTCDLPPQKAAKISPSGTSAQRLDYVWCDAQTYCSDGQTCCRGLGGAWNCCVYTWGVCCPDMVHCCPYGYVCLQHGASCGRSGSPRWDGKLSPLL
ncbi:uncharacterized protein LOC443608 isoform X1 [Xenopus laevis]|uniref:Uncharacterized protein LOC443608 isoform X1 n=1 Tax=Xenopus laevis TaxID=8355 RepID=A0A8J0TXM5_XENLA|nr:uncharacterized protein LOC443608 isoform X1 [Xenopus laevis]